MDPTLDISAAAGPSASALHQQQIGQALLIWSVGMYCIMCWEWLINLPTEIDRIWKRKPSSVSVLYFLNRYWALFQFSFAISIAAGAWNPGGCDKIFRWNPINSLVSQFISHVIMSARVYALFGQNKIIGGGLIALILVELVIGGVSVSMTVKPPQIPGVPFRCGGVAGPEGWMIAFWVMPLVFDTVTFAFTAWKTLEHWRKDFKTPLVRLIWRDGLIYFAIIFSMNLTNVIIFANVPRSLRPINLEPTVMLTVILSCRLVLNLRSMSSRGGNSTGNKSNWEGPPTQHRLALRLGATQESPPSSFRREKELPILPLTADIPQDVKHPTPPSTALSYSGYTHPYQYTSPPWEEYNPSQQFPRPPRIPGMPGAN